MDFWVINHSWESFKRTKEYCGFQSETERNKIKVGDKLAYFGNGIVFGIFEVTALPNDEFKGWEKSYSFQVKIKPLSIPNNPTTRGVLATPLKNKIDLQKSKGASANLVEITEQEFSQIVKAIEAVQKELKFA